MHVLPVNNQCFKGLFIDKSKENGGKWKMLYRPYSWELLPTGNYNECCDVKKPIMSPKEEADIYHDMLPNNEELRSHSYLNLNEPKDLLGTEFPYKYNPLYNKGAESLVEIGEPLTRLESLKIYYEKMKNFRDLKLDVLLRENTSSWGTGNPASYSIQNFYKIPNQEIPYDVIQKMDGTQRVLVLKNSINHVDDYLKMIEKEIKMYEDAKANGNLIDISNRGCADPNKPLWEALVKLNGEKPHPYKLLVGPHGHMPLMDLFNYTGAKVAGSFRSFNEQLCNKSLIDTLIKKAAHAIAHKRI